MCEASSLPSRVIAMASSAPRCVEMDVSLTRAIETPSPNAKVHVVPFDPPTSCFRVHPLAHGRLRRHSRPQGSAHREHTTTIGKLQQEELGDGEQVSGPRIAYTFYRNLSRRLLQAKVDFVRGASLSAWCSRVTLSLGCAMSECVRALIYRAYTVRDRVNAVCAVYSSATKTATIDDYRAI